MSPVEFFNIVTKKGKYTIGYLNDGWTANIEVVAATPTEAMMLAQNKIGDICGVTYVEMI